MAVCGFSEEALVGIPCSLSLGALIHRHESHTWSLERTESLTSDSQSGIMLSSVGTSKCNSPACVEARARRGAAFCIEDSRRPTTQYRDSVDSLRDSPHSERSDSMQPCPSVPGTNLHPRLARCSCGSAGETTALLLEEAIAPGGCFGRGSGVLCTRPEMPANQEAM